MMKVRNRNGKTGTIDGLPKYGIAVRVHWDGEDAPEQTTLGMLAPAEIEEWPERATWDWAKREWERPAYFLSAGDSELLRTQTRGSNQPHSGTLDGRKPGREES